MELARLVSIIAGLLIIIPFVFAAPDIDMPSSVEEGEPFDVTVSATGANALYLYTQQGATPLTHACIMEPGICTYTFEIVENRRPRVYAYRAEVEYTTTGALMGVNKNLEVKQSLNVDLTYPSTAYVGKEFTISIDAQDNIGVHMIEVTTPEGKLPPHIGIKNPKTLSKDYTFSYDKEGQYIYYIEVTDIDAITEKPGLTDFKFIQINVIEDNNLPTASLEATPRSGTAPLEVEFDVSGSSDADDNPDINYYDIISYELNFGDGSDSFIVEGSGIDMSSEDTISHPYNARDTPYLAILTVSDSDGSATASVSITVNAEDTTDDEDDEEEDDDTDVTPGGGGGGGRGDGGSPYRVSYPIEEGYATLSISEDHLELDAGDSFRIAVKVRGESGDYSLGVDADFGEIDVPEERYVYDKSTFYIEGKVDEDAEGKYVMKVNLLRNGEIVDTERVYVTIDSGFGLLEILGIVFLTLIALSGVGLLVYMLIRRGKGGQIDLRKYY